MPGVLAAITSAVSAAEFVAGLVVALVALHQGIGVVLDQLRRLGGHK